MSNMNSAERRRYVNNVRDHLEDREKLMEFLPTLEAIVRKDEEEVRRFELAETKDFQNQWDSIRDHINAVDVRDRVLEILDE